MTAAEPIVLCLIEASNAPGEPCICRVGHDGRHQDAAGQTWNDTFKRGRPDVYEVTWMSGHVERILAHQVSWPEAGLALTRSVFGVGAEGGPPRVRLHAEIAERWCLTLSAREEDIRSMRLVTDGEPMPGGEVR